ncbi:MAG: monovalent cation:proton antiporter-2 (CPA2) family protein [Myxococcota bacterium]|nr:monovalent cation:proton antiporter-2 (CPA2) family protein [Myxococcota bacterium]
MGLTQVLVLLAAVVVAVPLFKRLGLGSVLGYLAAGVVLGPSVLGVVTDVEGTFHLAELGVVLLLFLIGLELQPSRLWGMRQAVFGLGGAQVVGTTVVLGGVGLLFGLPLPTALVVGVGLSLSSTAFAMQLLAEKGQLTSGFGRASFSILLFQDLAVIPVMALLPVLGTAAPGVPSRGWVQYLLMLGALAVVVTMGRFLMKPLFRMVAATHSQEVFTATALLVAVGTAALMGAAGLSMALGAFLAGVLLAESEYRHELEADIEPFKGLLLGLFFMTVGMSVKLGILAQSPLGVLGLVVGLVAIKALCLFLLGRVWLKETPGALNLAVAISQGGEFAFVLFGLAVTYGLMPRQLSDLLVVVVSLSMAVTPPLYIALERWVLPRLKKPAPREYDALPDQEVRVVIAGFGRVGQVVGRVLRAKRIAFTAIDKSAEHIDFVRKFGNQVFYGDAGRLDLLRAAKVDRAQVFVLAIDDVEASLRTVATVKQHFPQVTIFARARNRQHAYALMDLGVKHVMRETFLSSLEMTGEILISLGASHAETRRVMNRFQEHDEQLLLQTYKFRQDLPRLQAAAEGARAELEQIFASDSESESRTG